MVGQGALVLSDDWQGNVVGKRHDLGYIYARAVGTEFSRQRVAAYEGNGQEYRVHPGVPCPGHQRSNRLIRAYHNHRFGSALLQVEQRRLDRGGVARIQADGHGRHVAAVKREADAAIARAPVGVILVQNSDARDAQVLRQTGDHLFGFLVVGRAQVDDVFPAFVAQELSAGEWRDERHSRGGGDRSRGARCRSAHFANKSEDFFFLDKP